MIDGEEFAIPNVPIIVLSAGGIVVAGGVTDDRGAFEIDLPATAGLTVSLPMNGVSELPIEAGVPVVIVVP